MLMLLGQCPQHGVVGETLHVVNRYWIPMYPHDSVRPGPCATGSQHYLRGCEPWVFRIGVCDRIGHVYAYACVFQCPSNAQQFSVSPWREWFSATRPVHHGGWGVEECGWRSKGCWVSRPFVSFLSVLAEL